MDTHAHEIDLVIAVAKRRIFDAQRADGAFSFCCEVAPLADATMVIFLHLLGDSSDPLIPELCNTLLRRQRPDGGWTVYPNEESNNSATVLSYFALLLSGVDKTCPPMTKARSYIRRYGGVTQVNFFVKLFLAVAGELPWSLLPEARMEFVLWTPTDPVSLFDVLSPTRLHIPSMLLLSHLNFSYRVPSGRSLRDLIAPGLELPPPRRQLVNRSAISACRDFLLQRLEQNGTLAGYLTATVMMVFALQALGYPRRHPILVRAVAGLKAMVYRSRTHTQQQAFTSTVWDTSLCMRALTAAGMPITDARMARAAAYLLSRQQRRVSDWIHHAPHARPGGFGFSHTNTLLPDVDDTTAAVYALYPFRHRHALSWRKAVRWMLAMQNEDGGWSAFDRNCDNALLQWLLGHEMEGTLTDPSTPDITGRVLETIGHTHVKAPAAVERAVDWLLGQQRADGSWYGRWGITYTYGTWAATMGLRRAGLAADHPAQKRAWSWIVGIQNADGGFGESWESDVRGEYVPLQRSTPSQTAWALMGMLATSPTSTQIAPLQRAARYLLHTARPSGSWRESYPTGAGVAGAAYIRYHSYPLVWPLLALSMYRRSLC